MWDLSSLNKNGTWIPYAGRQILLHWHTREVPFSGFLTYSKNTHLMFIFSLWGAVFSHLLTSGASQGAWALLQGKALRGRICSPVPDLARQHWKSTHTLCLFWFSIYFHLISERRWNWNRCTLLLGKSSDCRFDEKAVQTVAWNEFHGPSARVCQLCNLLWNGWW